MKKLIWKIRYALETRRYGGRWKLRALWECAEAGWQFFVVEAEPDVEYDPVDAAREAMLY